MKKTSKLFVGLALAGLLLTGCNFNINNDLNVATDAQEDIYLKYVADGGNLTYEEWLESIRGADGAAFLAGAADPDAGQGKNGDIYVNTTSWDVFTKVGGAWVNLGNLKGPQGEKVTKVTKAKKAIKVTKVTKAKKAIRAIRAIKVTKVTPVLKVLLAKMVKMVKTAKMALMVLTA